MKSILVLALAILLLASCEREFTPEISQEAPDLVVEGYIEAGENPLPPYVILTRSKSFYGDIDPGDFDELYVHDAQVTVHNNGIDYPLTEICLNALTEEQKAFVSQMLGLNADSITANLCFYVDVSMQLNGQEGQRYDLTIVENGKQHEATTTIPRLVPIDSFFFQALPGDQLKDYRELHAFLTDPGDGLDYWRYFTSINDSAYVRPNFSIYDDGFISGQTIEFVPNNGVKPAEGEDPLAFGLYKVGDSLSLKWASIDKAHYQFEKTAEFSANQGPFSSYVRIKGNVSDALGIWGGMNIQYLQTKIE